MQEVYSKNPIWLDLVFYKKDTQMEFGRIKGIINFITDTKMEYKVNFETNGDRPDHFDPDDNDNTMILDKVSN